MKKNNADLTKDIRINGLDITIQKIPMSSALELQDRYNIGTAQARTPAYMSALFKETVIAPREIAKYGMDFFDDRFDGDTPLLLLQEIQTFLQQSPRYTKSTGESEEESSKVDAGV